MNPSLTTFPSRQPFCKYYPTCIIDQSWIIVLFPTLFFPRYCKYTYSSIPIVILVILSSITIFFTCMSKNSSNVI